MSRIWIGAIIQKPMDKTSLYVCHSAKMMKVVEHSNGRALIAPGGRKEVAIRFLQQRKRHHHFNQQRRTLKTKLQRVQR